MARQLPRGPHSLTREEVAESQRRRLIDAMIQEAGSTGYAQTTVTDVIGRAGVSRKAFYEHFRNREDCFLAAYDRVIATSLRRIDDACRSAPTPADRVERGLKVLFGQASSSPAAVRLVLTEIGAIGEEGIRRREQQVEAHEDLLRFSLGLPSPRREGPNPILRALTGGVTEVLLSRVSGRKPAQLRRIAPEVAAWIDSYRPALTHVLAPLARDAGHIVAPDSVGGRAPGSLAPTIAGKRRGLRGDNTSTRSFVIHNQRERILDSVASLSTIKGYAAVSVRDIAEGASVSLDAFYEHFTGKEDAFLCAYEVGHARTLAIVESAYASTADWRTGVPAAIQALFELLMSEPVFARMALLQAPIATSQTAARARHGFGGYTHMLETGLDGSALSGPAGALAVEAISGGLLELCRTYTVFRRTEATSELLDRAAFFALAPFIGAGEAERTVLGAGGSDRSSGRDRRRLQRAAPRPARGTPRDVAGMADA